MDISALDNLETKAAAKKGPGSRGGNFYIDAHGRIRYGKKPTGKPKAGPKAPAVSNEQRLAEHNADRAQRDAEHKADRARHEAEHAAAEQRRAESHAAVMEARAKREATAEHERAAREARSEADRQQRAADHAKREAERAQAQADKARQQAQREGEHRQDRAQREATRQAAAAAKAQLQAARSMGDITAAGFSAAGTAATPEQALAQAQQLRADHPDQLVALLRVGDTIHVVTKPAGSGGDKPKKPKQGASNGATSRPRGTTTTAKEADSPLEVKGLEPSAKLARLERRYVVEVEDEIGRVYEDVAGHVGGE